MKRLILSVFLCLIFQGCDKPPKKHKYIETERGLVNYFGYYCELGMLLNNDRDNVMNENNKPITCSGYIELTKAEYLEATKQRRR